MWSPDGLQYGTHNDLIKNEAGWLINIVLDGNGRNHSTFTECQLI